MRVATAYRRRAAILALCAILSTPLGLSGAFATPATPEIAAKQDGHVKLTFRVDPSIVPGRYVIPIDVRYGRWTLPEWTEAIVVVGAPASGG